MPPPVLDCARVLYHAQIDKSVGYRGRTLLFVDGKELGPVPCMAICEHAKVGILLFHCNRDWRVLGCSGHDTVPAAKKKAEWIYPGLGKHWIRSRVTKAQAREFLNKSWGKLLCGFCNRRPDQVDRLFGRKGTYICGECVEKFHTVLIRSVTTERLG